MFFLFKKLCSYSVFGEYVHALKNGGGVKKIERKQVCTAVDWHCVICCFLHYFLQQEVLT